MINANPKVTTTESSMAWWQIVWRGMVMGVADLVPGVSGGTLALILGIYPRFIHALSQVQLRDAWQLLRLLGASIVSVNSRLAFKQAFVALWKKVDAGFLLCLFIGIGLSIICFAQLLSWALVTYPNYLFALFFGLIVMSLPWLASQVGTWRASMTLWFVFGLFLGAAVSVLNPVGEVTQLPLIVCFIAGAIVVSAMLMPGISGSFLLLLLGLYHGFIEAVKSLDVAVLGCFMVGALVSLLWFSKCIDWLLTRYRGQTMAALTGLVAGALLKIWPWHKLGSLGGLSLQLPHIPWGDSNAIVMAFIMMIIGAIIARILLKFNH